MAKKRLFTKFIIVLLSVALLLPNIFTLAHATTLEAEATMYVGKGIVTASGLNFRVAPNTSSKVITVLPRGTMVIIIEDNGEWLKVEYESEIGFLFKNHVGIIRSNGIITASGLNVRSEPTTASKSLGSLYRGTRVSILEEVLTDDADNPVWLKIAYKNGDPGYISKRYVNILTTQNGSYRKIGVTTALLLNLREDSTIISKSIATLPRGTRVIILESKSTDDFFKKWYKVDYNGQIGWLASIYVEEQEWVLATSSSTSSPNSGKNRNYNMSLASSSLTGTIILPGETFSWIKTMGSCSAAKGYLTAPVFENGKLSEGTGGGVCQVSTTINITAKKLNIQTKARQHSLPVSYATRSDEATVSYPYVDFSFTNTLETPILIELVSNNGTVICNIYTAE